jgi:antitoxin component YwqK of YwqJK toxin-antitoxin module
VLKAPLFYFPYFIICNFIIGFSAQDMKKIFVLISVFFYAILNAQSPGQNAELPWYMDVYRSTPSRYHIVDLIDYRADTINRKDAIDRQKGYWQVCLADSVTQMKFIAAEGYYYQGKKTGMWKYYHSNSKLRGTGMFVEGKLIGPYETYYEDGAIREKGNWDGTHEVGKHQFFKKDYLCSEWTYNQDGKVIERLGYFDSGKLSYKENDSLRIYFHPGGISKEVSHMRNGKLNGFSYNYDESGSLTEKTFYLNAQRHGQLFLYYKNGNIKFYGHYLGGKMSGERMYYNENGKPIDGNFVFYYSNGNKEREGFCNNGKPEGLVKLFYNDGALLMTAQHKNGEPHGKQTYYDTDGKTVTDEFIYINGQYAGMGKSSTK